MIYLNKVELQGIVGSIRKSEISGTYLYQITLATQEMYKRDTQIVCETTWHKIVWWSDDGKLLADKGTPIRVVGRINQSQYVDAYGQTHSACEIVANEVTIIKE